MGPLRTLLVSILLLGGFGQSLAHTQRPLAEFNAAVRELTARVSPAVVQILVSGYGPATNHDSTQTPLFIRQQGIGSGVILDPTGYIITNAHVVEGAERIQVVLIKPASSAATATLAKPLIPEQAIIPAKVVGISGYFDLALLKVDAEGLPVLPFADFHGITQGELVFAIGSPQGLNNSATMGIISAIARQTDETSPVAYVQTDAPINPGNSGGALVDVDGNLVGINTFIITEGGGSEGLGFALPAPIVKMVYRDLREKGHVDRRTIGIGAQQITPTLAQGLGLNRINGLIVSDVLPGGPADEAGMQVGDIIVEADGRLVTAPPQLDGAIYSKDIADRLNLLVLRGEQTVTMRLKFATVEQHKDPGIDAATPQKNIVRQLSVVATTLTKEMAGKIHALRIASGVVVIARTADPTEAQLEAGDVIHSVNNVPVGDIDNLRCQIEKLKHGDAVVLQVERQGGLQFVSFELE